MKDNNREILKLLKGTTTLSIIGMDKNVGKTTLLNHILREARGTLRLGLTSIGRDGEGEDLVTKTKKPRIYVERGTLIATSKQCLYNGDITREILKTTGMMTPMGEVILVRALSDGFVELGGPSINQYMTEICQDLKELGSELIIVDGAINRKTSASPAITEATILSTGAALSKSLDQVVEKTAHTLRLLSMEAEEDREIRNISRESLIHWKICVILEGQNIKHIDVPTPLAAARKIGEALKEHPRVVAIKGVITDKLLEDLMKATDEYRGVTFLIQDGTKAFLSRDTFYKFEKRGGRLKVLDPIKVICVSANPKSPFGYEFDKNKFLTELRSRISLPVFDVVGGG